MRCLVVTTLLLLLSLTSCASVRTPSPPSARVASPESVTHEDPGGDAENPIDAALTRLLEEPVGGKIDKFKTIVPRLPDHKNWRRVRFFGYPTRVAFRYGKDPSYAVAVIAYAEAENDSPSACLQRFVSKGQRIAASFDLEPGPVKRSEGEHVRGVEAVDWPAWEAEWNQREKERIAKLQEAYDKRKQAFEERRKRGGSLVGRPRVRIPPLRSRPPKPPAKPDAPAPTTGSATPPAAGSATPPAAGAGSATPPDTASAPPRATVKAVAADGAPKPSPTATDPPAADGSAPAEAAGADPMPMPVHALPSAEEIEAQKRAQQVAERRAQLLARLRVRRLARLAARAAAPQPPPPAQLRPRSAPLPSDLGTAAMPVLLTSGEFQTLLNDDRWLAAAVAYRSWPGTCLVQAYAVKVGSDEELAHRVIERWLAEMAPQLRWKGHLRERPPIANR